MQKILIIITTAFEPSGGLTTVMMNYYRNMNKDGLQIDFASTNDPEVALIEEVASYGSRYFNLGDRKKNILKYLSSLSRLIKKEKYDIVHVNGNSATMALELFVATMRRVSVRIAHGHTTRSEYPKAHRVLSPFFKKMYTFAIATSKKTGDWLYGNDYVILNNAIDVNYYQYSEKAREEVRTKLNITDKFVVGNVGKLTVAKNQTFLIDIFKNIADKEENAVLVIAGGGELEEELRQKCYDYHLNEKVIFLGLMDDVSQVLQAFDVFVFTSVYEGLGMALIEAQAAGLKCFASDAVPSEAIVSDNVQYLALQSTPAFWAENIMKALEYDRKEYCEHAKESIPQYGYDIEYEAEKLERIYRG